MCVDMQREGNPIRILMVSLEKTGTKMIGATAMQIELLPKIMTYSIDTGYK
jgi:hypothetical protein